jgi:hypothetical protein
VNGCRKKYQPGWKTCLVEERRNIVSDCRRKDEQDDIDNQSKKKCKEKKKKVKKVKKSLWGNNNKVHNFNARV